MDIAALLKQLSQTPGISGYETAIRSVVLHEWGRWADETRVDKVGNALAIRLGTAERAAARRSNRNAAPRRSIMLATHMHEIGLMVAGIKHGFIHLAEMGGVDARILPGQEDIAHGRRDLPGLVASTPPDLLKAAERHKVTPLEQLWVCGPVRSTGGGAGACWRPGFAAAIRDRIEDWPAGRQSL